LFIVSYQLIIIIITDGIRLYGLYWHCQKTLIVFKLHWLQKLTQSAMLDNDTFQFTFC